MCALRGSVNIPWTGSAESWAEAAASCDAITGSGGAGKACYVVCRLGNDSQLAATALMERADLAATLLGVKHIEGGFRAWREQVDSGWPEY